MKIFKFLLCIILIVAMCVTAVIPASAARVTYYLSDLKMAEADTEDEAKQLLKDAGFTVLNKNLNPGGKKAVFMGYKKSTKVDDAITDIRVMDMNGGFNITDYDTILKDALQQYAKEINNIRVAAKEFAENYKAGKKEALLAYRQLNYYYVEIDKKQVKMGDYMLDFPEKNEDFSDILMMGNTNILDNIRILLSMGVADGGGLIDRVKAAAADPAVYDKLEYFNDAKEMAGKIQQLKSLLKEAQDDISEIEADTEMTDEEKEAALVMPRYILTLLASFEVILVSIPCGDSNYSEYFETATDIDYSLLYPFIDAMTPGQRAMSVSGQLHSVLVYNAVEMSDEEIEADLLEIEKDYEPLSVYHGTDISLLEGAVGVTSEALREEAATGNSWIGCLTGNMAGDITISSLIGVGGIALLGISAHFLKQQIGISNMQKIIAAMDKSDYVVTEDGFIDMIEYDEYYEVDYKPTELNANATTSTSTIVLSSIGIAIGIAMIAFSIYSIVRIINQYNPSYTEIPSNMVDTVSTANGNRYINYTVVNSFYKDGDKTAEKAGDTNGYEGNQWNAIYYTKSYEAGKCMTSTGYFLDSADSFGKYTPVAKFGNVNAYDLNSFNGNESKESIYMAFGNSNNKKSAETDVPTVVGSVFAYGGMAISGVAGIGLGMLFMGLIKNKKKTEEK